MNSTYVRHLLSSLSQAILLIACGANDPHDEPPGHVATTGHEEALVATPSTEVTASTPPESSSPTERVRRLLLENVPRVRDGSVVLRAVARNPGRRTKVVVSSPDADVDPIDAVVGPNGAYIQRVVQGLDGEPVDVIPWDDEPSRLVALAVAPVTLTRILMDEEAHEMALVVADEDLQALTETHLALAAQVTGWTLLAMPRSRADAHDDDWAGLARAMP